MPFTLRNNGQMMVNVQVKHVIGFEDLVYGLAHAIEHNVKHYSQKVNPVVLVREYSRDKVIAHLRKQYYYDGEDWLETYQYDIDDTDPIFQTAKQHILRIFPEVKEI